MMYAEYNGKKYRCSMTNGGKNINLLSDTIEDGFSMGLSCYIKKVERDECTRVFRKELCFKYNGDVFLVKEDEGDRILLETGPRSYKLEEYGFLKILNDVYQKWVDKRDGELFWSETDY